MRTESQTLVCMQVRGPQIGKREYNAPGVFALFPDYSRRSPALRVSPFLSYHKSNHKWLLLLSFTQCSAGVPETALLVLGLLRNIKFLWGGQMMMLLVLRACRQGDSKVLSSEYVCMSSEHGWAGRAMAESVCLQRKTPNAASESKHPSGEAWNGLHSKIHNARVSWYPQGPLNPIQ